VEVRTAAVGISGLDRDPAGQLWVVPERDQRLIPVGLDGAVGSPVPFQGIPTEVDTEAVAWLGPGRIALGLESPSEGAALIGGERCDLAIMERKGAGPFRLVRCLAMPLAAWSLTPRPNRGAEGICHAGARLAAAYETVLERDGQRLAALAVHDLAAGTWRRFSLLLTSDASQKGKISALHCEPGPAGALRLATIERHFGLRRLVLYDIPAGGGDGEVLRARRIVQLSEAQVAGANPEGLCRLDRGRWAVINDNHYGRRQGPTILSVLKVEPSAW